MSMDREDMIEYCLERIRSAWNAGDAKAFAAEFTEDATFVVWTGTPLLGRLEIERAHLDVLARETSMKL